MLILAGCGGAARANWQQVHGTGFSYSAPATWTLAGGSASNGTDDLVEVQTFRLERTYASARRIAVTQELDRDAESIAGQLDGKVVSRSAPTVAGLRAWGYAIDYDGKTEEITFVLRGDHEYELLCRHAQDSSNAACTQLLRTFRAS